jgi:hypothetical protein
MRLIKQPLWDIQTFDFDKSGGYSTLKFFQSARVDNVHSNMVNQGQLPDPITFLLGSLQVLIQIKSATATKAVIDVGLLTHGTAIFNINGAKQFEVPIPLCPGGGGMRIQGMQALATEYVVAGNGSIEPDAIFVVDPKIEIPPKVAFDVTLDWGAIAASAVSADADIMVVLGGHMQFPS